MGEQTGISWCHHTFNPWIGCTKVSPACDGCYAAHLMGMDGRMKRVEWGEPGKGAGTRSRTSPSNWKQPLKWDREQSALMAEWSQAVQACHDLPKPPPRFVFCASLADVFDNEVSTEWRRDLFDLIRATPHLTWLLLTKRPQNIVRLFRQAMGILGGANFSEATRERWPFNAAIGTTIEDRKRLLSNAETQRLAGEALKPAITFWSCEPLLEDLGDLPVLPGWVITGGETDQGAHKARPTHPDWFRGLRDQCAAAGVPYHHKQNGEWAPDPELDRDFLSSNVGVPIGTIEPLQSSKGRYAVAWLRLDDDGVHARGIQLKRVGKTRSGRLLDGVLHDAMPAPHPLDMDAHSQMGETK